MTLTIELPDELGIALEACAKAHRETPAGYAQQVLAQVLISTTEQDNFAEPSLKTGRGLLAKYGPAPSAEEIEANRADMFRDFAERF